MNAVERLLRVLTDQPNWLAEHSMQGHKFTYCPQETLINLGRSMRQCWILGCGNGSEGATLRVGCRLKSVLGSEGGGS